MSMTWKLDDSTNDLTIQNGSLVLTNGADEIKQRILVTLRHEYGEYFLNTDDGVPWYEGLLGSSDRVVAESILRFVILSVPGVVSIIGMSTSFVNRSLSFSCQVEVQTIEDQSTDTITVSMTYV